MKKTKIIVLTIYVLAISTYIASAQGPGFDADVEDAPVDGGITVIIAAAACYAVKKIADKNK